MKKSSVHRSKRVHGTWWPLWYAVVEKPFKVVRAVRDRGEGEGGAAGSEWVQAAGTHRPWGDTTWAVPHGRSHLGINQALMTWPGRHINITLTSGC